MGQKAGHDDGSEATRLFCDEPLTSLEATGEAGMTSDAADWDGGLNV